MRSLIDFSRPLGVEARKPKIIFAKVTGVCVCVRVSFWLDIDGEQSEEIKLNKVTAHSIRSRTINSAPLFSPPLFAFQASRSRRGRERRGENTFTITIQPRFGTAQLGIFRSASIGLAFFRLTRTSDLCLS
jgi:hypothetical protein